MILILGSAVFASSLLSAMSGVADDEEEVELSVSLQNHAK